MSGDEFVVVESPVTNIYVSESGSPGKPGVKGDRGDDGTNGTDGADGKSAYEVWLDQGNTGTEEDFLLTLRGAPGQDGTDGSDGIDGNDGIPGDSAYDIWLSLGNVGSEQDFIDSLKGPEGPAGMDGRSTVQALVGNRYRVPDGATTYTATTVFMGREMAVRTFLRPGQTFTRIGIYSNTTPAQAPDTVLRFGVRDNTNGRPGPLIKDAGTAPLVSGYVEVTTDPITVPANGVIWLTVTPQTTGAAASVSLAGCTGTAIDTDSNPITAPNGGILQFTVPAELPAAWAGAGMTVQFNPTAPMICIRL